MSTDVMFSMLALSLDLLVSLSLLVTLTTLEIFPEDITSAMIVRLWVSPLFRLPITHVLPSYSPILVLLEISLRWLFKISLTYTPVALQGPMFVTVIVNSIKSVTFTIPLTLTFLVICRSTLVIAVMFLMLALLLV